MALTRGERLDCIKQIAAALVGEELPQAELALDTFGAIDTNRWEYDSDIDYILARLRSSDDDIIVELKSYLNGQGASVSVPESDGPWHDGYIRLFLTHTHPNKVLAKNIRERLLLYGIDTFVAHEMIEVSKEWQEEIELALATCNALAALVTKDLILSPYCDQEIGYAMDSRVVIIPVRQEADPHGFFAKYHGAPGDKGPYAHLTIADGIFDALVRNPKTKDDMGLSIVRRYCTSTSYDYARKNTAYLLNLPEEQWTDEMVDAVEKAGSENSQLEDGVWIPDNRRIPDLVRAHLDELLHRAESSADTSDFARASEFASSGGSDDDIPF
jgi:hypothetical protein